VGIRTAVSGRAKTPATNFRRSGAIQPKPISEKMNALVVNAHGVLVLLAMKLFAGDAVTPMNPQIYCVNGF
jgi:hypothetical protein